MHQKPKVNTDTIRSDLEKLQNNSSPQYDIRLYSVLVSLTVQ